MLWPVELLTEGSMVNRILVVLVVLAATTAAGSAQKPPKKPAPTAPASPASALPPRVVPDPGSHPPPPPAAGQPETVDTILKRLAAVRAERDALAREEAALKDRLRERLREQGELIRSLGLDPGAAPAPATPAAGTPPLYFPTTVGTERVYLIGDREVRDVVTAVGRDGDAYLVTLAKPDLPGGEVRVLSVSPDRVLIHRSGEYRYQPPHVVLRPTAKVGDSWHLFGVPGEGEVHRLAGAEEVTVPAGTFRTLRVDYGKDTPAGFEAAGSLWYAPGVGSVKNTRGGKDVLLLKSFKPGDGTAPPGAK
jgi:hypothetical protein